MSLRFSNFAKAVIASAPSGTTGLSFTVEAGKGILFPSLGVGDYFYATFKDASGNREIVKVAARSVDSMSIATGGRGLDGTTARTWAAGDMVVLGLTNIALQESLANVILSAIGNLPAAADELPYFTGPSAADITPFTAFARQLLACVDALSMRNLLGAAGQAFPTGTSMLFYNASAPAGWTHDTSALDHAIRIVAGGGIGGTKSGSVGFSAAFKSQAVAGTVGSTTLSTAQIPAHPHTYSDVDNSGTPAGGTYFVGSIGNLSTKTSGYTGGGGSHNHTFVGTNINLAVNYMNTIVATKT